VPNNKHKPKQYVCKRIDTILRKAGSAAQDKKAIGLGVARGDSAS